MVKSIEQKHKYKALPKHHLWQPSSPHKTVASRLSGPQTNSPRWRESSPLTFSTSPYEATRIMTPSLALIQSGKILISVQCPGNSHHAYFLSWGLHGPQGAGG